MTSTDAQKLASQAVECKRGCPGYRTRGQKRHPLAETKAEHHRSDRWGTVLASASSFDRATASMNPVASVDCHRHQGDPSGANVPDPQDAQSTFFPLGLPQRSSRQRLCRGSMSSGRIPGAGVENRRSPGQSSQRAPKAYQPHKQTCCCHRSVQSDHSECSALIVDRSFGISCSSPDINSIEMTLSSRSLLFSLRIRD